MCLCDSCSLSYTLAFLGIGATHIKLHGWPPRNALVGAEAESAAGTEGNASDLSKQPVDDMRGRYAQQEDASAARCCELCHESFGALWLHRGVCYACEMELRETVRLPARGRVSVALALRMRALTSVCMLSQGRCPFATQKIAAGCGGLPHTFCCALFLHAQTDCRF
eukprot:COSAG03_NODE_2524_length_2675_cov_3968.193323_4_plen_167_part_00